MPQASSTSYKTLVDPGAFKGKRVLLRLDLNVPIVDGQVRDDFRIRESFPTLRFLKGAGAKTIIISHIESAETDSLEAVSKYVNSSYSLSFAKTFADLEKQIPLMKDGDIIMYENLRRDPGEKANDQAFARKLANLADVYVNEAFPVSHRAHASVALVPKLLPSFAGLRFDAEVKTLSESFDPPRPALFAIGGAKFETKIPIVKRFLKVADHVFVGGALANDIYKERGLEVGKSVVAKAPIKELGEIASDPKLIVPTDAVVRGSGEPRTVRAEEIGPEDIVADAGPDTIAQIEDLLTEVKYVIWNGPLGDYERGFSKGTEELARIIIESGVKCVVGGGDSVAVLEKAKLLSKFSFVSTGGGAMLEFLAQGTLPGIEALKS